jgi:co-chaperonin GroES (HSP10)
LTGAEIATRARPLGDRVLLKRLPKDELAEQTEGGIWLPQQSVDVHQQHMQGEVVAVGPDVIDRTLLPGLRVIVGRYFHAALDRDGDYWITNEDNIAAILLEEE